MRPIVPPLGRVTVAPTVAPTRGARARFAVATALAMLVIVASMGRAQDAARTGVRIGLAYDASAKPGVIVLPVRGVGGDSVRAILQRDLDFGDRVTIISGDGPAPFTGGAQGLMNYALAAKLGIAAIVEGVFTPRGGVRLTLHDVGQAKAIDTREVTLPNPANSEAWRAALHAASDAIEEMITGTRGVAATRILFVRGKRVWRTDADGAFPQPITDAGALSPAWHPNGSRIAYSQFGDNGIRIVTQELGGAPKAVPGTSRGLNITPTFGPDGATLVYAHGDGNGTDLVATTDGAAAEDLRPLTVGRGSDNVSPTFAPDGRRIAYTSGRAGHPEVYISDADGTNAELLTSYAFGDRAYRSNPSWSPDGRAIAFQSQLDGRFQVMTIALRDRGVKQHTSDGENEDPSWAPDGRHLAFVSTRTGRRELFVLDVETGRVRQLTQGGDARMPAWSPAQRPQ